jgi:hypothetical protein
MVSNFLAAVLVLIICCNSGIGLSTNLFLQKPNFDMIHKGRPIALPLGLLLLLCVIINYLQTPWQSFWVSLGIHDFLVAVYIKRK